MTITFMPEGGPPAANIGPGQLFWGWAKVGALGFGGVMPWAYRIVVLERRWMSAADYMAMLGLAQVLPGPNTPNICVMLGMRFCGWRGACASVLGLMAVPLLAVLAIGLAYDLLLGNIWVGLAIGGAAAAGAGLVLGAGLRMIRAMKWDWSAGLVCLAVFAAVGLFRTPLIWTLAILAPLSIVLTIWRRKGKSAGNVKNEGR